MGRIKLLLLALAIFLGGAQAAPAQDELLFGRVQHAVENVEPEYELAEKWVLKGFVAYVWRGKSSRAPYELVVMVNEYESPKWARMAFESEPWTTRTHGGIDMRVLPEKVIGLGDDNYRWEVAGSDERGVNFRQGRYHVQVYARTFDEAERVARYIVGIFPAARRD